MHTYENPTVGTEKRNLSRRVILRMTPCFAVRVSHYTVKIAQAGWRCCDLGRSSCHYAVGLYVIAVELQILLSLFREWGAFVYILDAIP